MPRGVAPVTAGHSATGGVAEEVVRLLAARGVVRNYPRHAVIITEGDVSDTLYVVLSGRLKVYLGDESGKEVVLEMFGPGDYVGEMAFDAQPRSASVMTVEPSVLSVVSQAAFRDFLAAHPDATMHLIRTLIQRARGATEAVRSLALMDVYGRVARLLLELARDEAGVLVIAETLTQQDIANRVGCSREMVSRIFKDLVAGGYIGVEGRHIRILRTPPKRW